MNLYSGTPYWIVKNPLYDYHNPLKEDISVDVAIIGSGITGALAAHELCREGLSCCVLDKRSVATGSSAASTALLQYEIDVPLVEMIERNGEKNAVTAYRSCLQSITDLENILRKARVDASFERVPSIFMASNRKGMNLIKREYEARKQYDLPVTLFGRKELNNIFNIKAPGALVNSVSAQIDTYAAATGLLAHDIRRNNLKVYSHTEVIRCERQKDSYLLHTASGQTVLCKYVVVAAGFEAGKFLPRKLMKLTSTFAIISEPVEPEQLWYKRSLIWETREPYLYVRTDDHNRIIVGGEDEEWNSAKGRRFLLPSKAQTLEKKFRKLFPDIPFKTEMSWAGTFSSTEDGLPLIGATDDDPRMLFALGYGGNGITFSVIAAQILSNIIHGRQDPRAETFSLERPSL